MVSQRYKKRVNLKNLQYLKHQHELTRTTGFTGTGTVCVQETWVQVAFV